jgi:hypothetical protein
VSHNPHASRNKYPLETNALDRSIMSTLYLRPAGREFSDTTSGPYGAQ